MSTQDREILDRNAMKMAEAHIWVGFMTLMVRKGFVTNREVYELIEDQAAAVIDEVPASGLDHPLQAYFEQMMMGYMSSVKMYFDPDADERS